MDNKKEKLYNDCVKDLLRVVVVLAEILEYKQLTSEDEMRIRYGKKVVNNVCENQKEINKL